jgi:competence protein ComGF
MYFIIGGILLSLVLSQFSSGLTKEINEAQFFEFLKAGDVEKIMVQQKEEVEVYLNKQERHPSI